MSILVCVSLLLRGGHSGASAQSATPNYAEARAHARKVGNELLARGIPGLAISVAVNGRVVYAEGFGYADFEQRVPRGPEPGFALAASPSR